MQVQLKQAEIIAALKQYISGQGISLQGKQVEMAFTAGRKESGISVEISIDDVDIPDFFKGESEDTAQAPAPTATGLSLVQDCATASIANDTTEASGDAFFKSEETAAPDGGEGNVVQAEPTTLIPAGKSLFN